MSSDNEQDGKSTALAASEETALVTRSVVPADLKYDNYRQYLRYDFFSSCAYCTISEAEALAIRFTIDHYEPQRARPDLTDDYANLMYACDECNTRKGDRCPPSEARADGYRFFRPDEDIHHQHFQRAGLRLESKSHTGEYTIESLDLNRQALRRLRDIRERLTKCHPLVVEGVLGLRKFQIDQLPPNIKGRAVRAIKKVDSVAKQMADDIDALLRDHATSPLIDPDPEADARAKDRRAKLKRLEGLYPGDWRGRHEKAR